MNQASTLIGRDAGIAAIPVVIREAGKPMPNSNAVLHYHGFGRSTVENPNAESAEVLPVAESYTIPSAPRPTAAITEPYTIPAAPQPTATAATVAVSNAPVSATVTAPKPKIPITISRPSMGKLRIRAHDVVVSEGLVIIGFDTSVDDGDVYEPPEALTKDDPLVVTVGGKSYNCLFSGNWTADYRGMFSVVLLRVE